MADAYGTGRRKRASLAEIAAKAGVSRQVVAAVLNTRRTSNVRFSEDTRDRVMAIVEQSNWRPNRTAQSLARRHHGNIGILVRNFGSMPQNVLPAMVEQARSSGQVLSIDSMTANGGAMPLFVKEDSVDAIVVFEDVPAELLTRIRRLGIPCAQVNTNSRDREGCITFDEEGAMLKVARHFAEAGRYRTLQFHSKDGGYWVGARIEGLRKAATEVGMREPYLVEVDRQLFGEAHYRRNVEQIKRALREHGRIDSVLLMSDKMAPMFYQAAEELGRRIPQDMAVVGMHNTGVASLVAPLLSVLHIAPDELGQYIVEVVNAGIDGEDEYRSPAAITYDLQASGSSTRGAEGEQSVPA